MLDDCNFHQSVSLDKFESERLLELMPPDGEFAVMNYRSTYPFKPPFRVQTTIEDDANTALKVSHAPPEILLAWQPCDFLRKVFSEVTNAPGSPQAGD